MISRFEGVSGKRILVETLLEQKLVAGDYALAEEIAIKGELIPFRENDVVITQGGIENDIYLILTGACRVIINGRHLATRIAGTHIGEMTAIQPTQRRASTIVADNDVVLLKLTEPVFSDLTIRYPFMWRCIAKELARRLEQRNAFVSTTHDKVRVFIVSSAEALEIARCIQDTFEHDPYTVVIWTDGVFRASTYPIEALEEQLDQSDFAIAIAQPDDVTTARGKTDHTPRDNVLFELGLFLGRLGRRRALLLEPRGEHVKLPSDLSGITTIPYKVETERRNLAMALGPACNHIRNIIRDLGPNN